MGRAVALVAGLAISLFAVTGFAQDEAGGGSIVSLLVILAVFGAVFYFMLIRPQRKRQAKQNELVQGLKRGDKIVTAGGIHGEIDSISDTSVVLSLEDGGKLRLSKGSVVSKQTK
jgi:preprotein translocase subunit YajC